MKNIVASVFLFLLIGVISFFSVHYLKNMTSHMYSTNAKVINSIKSGNWKDAEKTALEFSDDWHYYSNISSIFVNHTLIDDVSIEEHKMEEFVKYKNKDEALSSASSIQFLIERIKKLETVNIQNVF